jgi:hypothetical protein
MMGKDSKVKKNRIHLVPPRARPTKSQERMALTGQGLHQVHNEVSALSNPATKRNTAAAATAPKKTKVKKQPVIPNG